MLTVRLDDVFASLAATDDEASIIRLHEHILGPSALNIVDNGADWPALA